MAFLTTNGGVYTIFLLSLATKRQFSLAEFELNCHFAPAVKKNIFIIKTIWIRFEIRKSKLIAYLKFSIVEWINAICFNIRFIWAIHLPKLFLSVNECFVPRLDSRIKPGKSFRNIVACCYPSLLYMHSSHSFLLDNAQLPMTNLVVPGFDRIGWLTELGFTWLRARCSFSKNSPRFSANIIN